MTHPWRYRAATAAGDLVEGVVQAASSQAALDELRRRQLVPVAVDEAPPAGRAPGGRGWRPGAEGDAVAAAFRTLATLLAGGATLDEALRFATAHGGTPRVRAALGAAHDAVRAGAPLSAALQRHEAVFGRLAAATVRAGEEGGGLDAALARLADESERRRDLEGQLRAALLYPALLGVVAGGAVLVILTLVVPRFAAVLRDGGTPLPLSTRLLVAASEAVVQGWWILATFPALAVAAWQQAMRAPARRHRWHAARLRWPVTGALEREFATAQLLRALGTLLRSGTPLPAALRVARETLGNAALAAALDAGARAVERGESLAAALGEAFPPLAVQLLAVGEAGGALDAMALQAADAFDASARRRLRAAVGLVEPALIVIFGAGVGFVALAMLQAVYAINASAL